MDDNLYVFQNPHLDLSIKNVWYFLTHSHEFLYHPLSLISFMADHALFGINPTGYHIFNLGYHAANAVLLYLLLEKLTGNGWKAFFAAALFTIHPLRVESVAWVSERKDVLAVFFGLAATHFYLRFVNHRLNGLLTAWTIFYPLLVAALILSLMAKPALVTLPFLLLVLDFWPLSRRRPGEGSSRAAVRLALEKLPLILIVVIWAVVSRAEHPEGAITGITIDVEPDAANVRILAAPVILVRYLLNHVLIHRLAIPYPMPAGGFPVWMTVASSVILLAITAAVAWQWKRRPWLISGWAWFLISLGPFVGIAYIGDYALADRYTYFADIGLLYALVWSIPAAWFATPALRKRVTVGCALLMAILIGFSNVQASYWKNDATLFGHAVQVTDDNARAYMGLAGFSAKAGDHAKAAEYYEIAARSAPDERIFVYLGMQRLSLKDLPAARAAFVRAITINPEFAEAHYWLGMYELQVGEPENASSEFQRAIAIDAHENRAKRELTKLQPPAERLSLDQCTQAMATHPEDPTLHSRLGELFDDKQQFAQAVAEYQKAIQLGSKRAVDFLSLGSDLFDLQQTDRAIECYEKALALSPGYADAHMNLALALMSKGKYLEAARQSQAAFERRPDFFEAYVSYGRCMTSLKRSSDAIPALRTALRLHPGDKEAEQALAIATRRAGQ